MRTQLIVSIGLALPLVGLFGCNREQPISFYRAPKETDKPSAPVASADARPAAEEQIQWTLPAGWTAKPGSGMRYATIVVDGEQPPMELSVMALPPQPLAANVNRWEQQLGLPPTPEGELSKVVKRISTDGVEVELVDLTGAKQADQPQIRMLAAMLPRGGKVWFFKMVGPAGTIEPQKAKFEAFLKSVRFAGGAASAGAGAAEAQPAPHAHEVKLAKFDTPAGWKQDTAAQPPRMLAFVIGDESRRADVVVSKFAPSNFGDLPSNINRWRQQVGLEPAADGNSHLPEQVSVGRAQALMWDITGPSQRMLVTMGQLGEDVWFFKMTGPKEIVAQQKDAFLAFLKSVQFEAHAH